MRPITRAVYDRAQAEEFRACIEAEVWKAVIRYATTQMFAAVDRAKEAHAEMIDAWEAGQEYTKQETSLPRVGGGQAGVAA